MNIFDDGTHTYKVNGLVVPGVTSLLQIGGFIQSRWFADAARWRGSNVHIACMYDDLGTLDEDSEDGKGRLKPIEGYLDAWRRFKREYIHNGDSLVIDLKSGAVQPWTSLQLCGYIGLKPPASETVAVEKPLWSRTYAGRPDRVWMRDTKYHLCRRIGVQLMPSGKYDMKEFPLKELTDDTRIFQGLVAQYHWREFHKCQINM